MTTNTASGSSSNQTLVLGRNDIGIVAEDGGMQFYLTDCCVASAKGSIDGVVCRKCYGLIDPMLGGLPKEDGPLTEVYGDGIPHDEFLRRRDTIAGR